MTNCTGNWIVHNINYPQPVHFWHLYCASLGAALIGSLIFVKNRFFGFPIYSIGLAIGLLHPVQIIWPRFSSPGCARR